MIDKEVSFHPIQFDAFNFKTQYAAAIAGIQSGKTFLGCYWIANQISQYQDESFLIAAPSYKMLQQSTLQKFFQEFPQFRKWYKEQKQEIQLPTGGTNFVRSMDNPLSVEGMTIRAAWLDEAGQMPLMSWTVVRSRTSITRGKVLITTTPYNMGWLYQNFYLPWQRGEDEDLSVFTWPSISNPYFDKDFFLKEKKRLKPEEFSRRYEGTFAKMEGLVYDIKNYHLLDTIDFKPEITIAGINWGYKKAAAIVVIKIHQDKYYIVDEWYEAGKTQKEIVQQMMKMQNQHGINTWYDGSKDLSKTDFASRNTGLYVLPYENKKEDLGNGISLIQQLMVENRVYLFNKCINTYNDFETYSYFEEKEDGENKKLDEPMDKNNRLMDAMRFAIHGHMPASRFLFPKKPANKNIFDKILSRLGSQKVNNNRYD